MVWDVSQCNSKLSYYFYFYKGMFWFRKGLHRWLLICSHFCFCLFFLRPSVFLYFSLLLLFDLLYKCLDTLMKNMFHFWLNLLQFMSGLYLILFYNIKTLCVNLKKIQVHNPSSTIFIVYESTRSLNKLW